MRVLRRDGDALARYERQTSTAVLVASLILIPVTVVPLVVDLKGPAAVLVDGVSDTFWVLFTLHYLTRLHLAPAPANYVRHNLFDLAMILLWVLPIVIVPRGGQLLRSLFLLRLVPLVLATGQRLRRRRAPVPLSPPV